MLKYLYLIQAANKLPEIYEHLRSKDFVLLSYEKETEDTDIFYPDSTWTQGKNKLREYSLSLKEEYDYYIYLDEDIIFEGVDGEAGVDAVENLLLKYKPIIAVPSLNGVYGVHHEYNNLKTEAQTTYWIDGCFDCWSKDTFRNSKIFPMHGLFDYAGSGCWASCNIMQKLCRIYHENQIVLFNNIAIINTQSKPDQRRDNHHEETDQYVLSLIKKDSGVSKEKIDGFLEWSRAVLQESPAYGYLANNNSDYNNIEIKEGDRTYLNSRIGFRK
jgi:hypothetical protein